MRLRSVPDQVSLDLKLNVTVLWARNATYCGRSRAIDRKVLIADCKARWIVEDVVEYLYISVSDRLLRARSDR